MPKNQPISGIAPWKTAIKAAIFKTRDNVKGFKRTPDVNDTAKLSMHNPTAKTKSSNNDTCYLIMFRRKVIEKQRNNRRKIGNISISIYFRFSAARYNHLKNKLLANYLRNRGNDLATVRNSAFCVAILSNNSFICKYNIFFRKYELSVAIL